jgi:serine/threonine protein kinase
VAVKVGLKSGAIAIAREAEVLSALSGVPGFPTLLHHEVAGPDTPGGALVMNLLGPDLDDLLHGPKQSDGRGAPKVVAASTLLRVGATLLRLLRSLHRAGFVHNDVKPSNILLDAGATTLEPRSRLYLVDFGSCTRAPGCIGAVGERGAVVGDSQPHGPLGSILFASVAADECDAHSCATRPADDIESLVYTLTYLAAGSLPWHGQPAALTTSIKRGLLTSRGSTVAALTDGVDCPTCTQALQALYAEVRRCHQSCSGAEIDYEACLAVFDEHLVLSIR